MQFPLHTFLLKSTDEIVLYFPPMLPTKKKSLKIEFIRKKIDIAENPNSKRKTFNIPENNGEHWMDIMM